MGLTTLSPARESVRATHDRDVDPYEDRRSPIELEEDAPQSVTCGLLNCIRDLGVAESQMDAMRLQMEHLEADHGFCGVCERLANDCWCARPIMGSRR